MLYYLTAVGVVAGICLGFGILFLFVGLRRKSNKPLNLTFSLFALCYAATLLTGTRWHAASTLTEYLAANRFDAVYIVGAFVGLIWYVAIYTGVKPRIFLSIVSIVYVIVGTVRIINPTAFLGQIQGLDSLVLPWGETLSILDSEGSVWLDLFLLAQLISLGFIIVALARQYLRGERQPAIILGLGMVPFLVGILYEILGESGIVDYIPFGEVGFIGFAFAASLQMANSVIKTEEELAHHQDELASQVEERTAELREVNKLLVVEGRISGAAEERRRLAAELHDSVTQTLYSVSIIAAALPRLLDRNVEEARRTALHLRNMTLGALAEMRTLLYELRPETFESANLSTLLLQTVDVFTGRTHLPVEVSIPDTVSSATEINLTFYRIAQEALNNIEKHAVATVVQLQLIEDEHGSTLIISDNGIGFDLESVQDNGHGMSIMRERASEPGFSLDIKSLVSSGTTITTKWRKVDIDE